MKVKVEVLETYVSAEMPLCEMSVEFWIFRSLISEICTESSVWVCVEISRLPRLMHFELSAARDLFMH